MEFGDLPSSIQRPTNIMEVNNLAIGRIDEWNPVSFEVERAGREAFGIAFGLRQDFRANGYLFGFYDAKWFA